MNMILKRQSQLNMRNKKGFTLVEVIVVLVILAILMAIAIPALTGYIDKAKEKSAIADTRIIATALQAIVNESYGSGAIIYDWVDVGGKVRIKGAYAAEGTLYSEKTYLQTVNELTGSNYTKANFGNNGRFFFDKNSKGTATLIELTFVTDDGAIQVVYTNDLATGTTAYNVTHK